MICDLMSLCNVETDNLTILDSILTLQFMVINYCLFYSTTSSLIIFFFFDLTNAKKKHGKNDS